MGRQWVTVTGTIRAIASVDASVAERTFGTPDAVALGGWPGARTGRSWGSYSRFAEDVAAAAVPSDVTVAMYDPENWGATPLAEKRDPVPSIEAFCTLARSVGYSVIITPHPNLVEVPGSVCAPKRGETREAAYVRSGIVEASAAKADAYETQAQKFQRDPASYRSFVLDTAKRARHVNPNVRVLSGLSTHPGYPATTEMLLEAWESVRDVVDGHYLSLARLRLPGVACAFLSVIIGRDA